MESDTEIGDAGSLASTQPSEQDSEYEIDEILCERNSSNGSGVEYLVKWTDYELFRAEFVKTDQLDAPELLRNWQCKKREIAEGRARPFDIDGWQADLQRRAQETEARKQARRAKRAERERKKAEQAKRDRLKILSLFEDSESGNTNNLSDSVAKEADATVDARCSSPQIPLAARSEDPKRIFPASEDSFLFVADETSSGSKPKRRRLLGHTDNTLFEPFDPNAAPNTNNIPSDSPDPKSQLQRGLKSQSERQPGPARQPAKRPERPPVAKSRQSSRQQQKGISPTSPLPASNNSFSGFGKPQTSRPRRPIHIRNWVKEPDVNQLQLLKPREFPAREGGADSSLYTMIRSPEDAQSPSGGGDNSSVVAPAVNLQRTRTSSEPPTPAVHDHEISISGNGSSNLPVESSEPLPVSKPSVSSALSQSQPMPLEAATPSSQGRPDKSRAETLHLPHDKEISGTMQADKTGDRDRSIPRLSSSSVARSNISPSYSAEPNQTEQREAESLDNSTSRKASGGPSGVTMVESPTEVSRLSPKEGSGQFVLMQSPPHEPRAEHELSNERLPDRREKPPAVSRTFGKSPHTGSSAFQLKRNERPIESMVGRSRSPLIGGDSYRPGRSGPLGTERASDCYRPSPSPPASESPHGNVNVHSNSPRPTARPAAASLWPLVTAPAPRRSSPSSRSPRSQNNLILDREALITRMPIGVPILGQSQRTKEGYFWNYGEILAHVYFGSDKEAIGAVRICGMSDRAKTDLLGSKGPGRKFEFWFNELYTKDEYSALTDKAIDNSPHGNAWLEGFQDTNPALFDMSEKLREQGLVGIYRPAKSRGNVWLAYSRYSPDFSFLNWNTARTPGGVPIYLAVRPPLPDTSALNSRDPAEPSRARRDFPGNVNFREDTSGFRGPAGDRPDLRRPSEPEPTDRPSAEAISSTRGDYADSQTAGEAESRTAITMDPRLRRRSSPQDSIHPSRRALMEAHPPPSSESLPLSPPGSCARNEQPPKGGDDFQETDSVDMTSDEPAQSTAQQQFPGHDTLLPNAVDAGMKMIMDYFEKDLKMSVKELSRLGGSNEDASTDNFYLHFPQKEEARKEYTVMKSWLMAHDLMVWTDWGKFLKNCKRGVVIFHESFIQYWDMRPVIRHALWTGGMKFWTVRLSRPLDPGLRFCKSGAHFYEIFGGGHAYLITEDVFADLSHTAMILCWFYGFQRNRPGAWKLFLRPDVMDHLEQRLEALRHNSENDGMLLTIISWIMKANSVDPRCPHFKSESLDPSQLDRPNNNILSLPLPSYGSRTEADNPNIPKDLTQSERDADHLVELFAGFTIMNTDRFRKTIVITSVKHPSLIARWQNWGHVAVYSVKNFFSTFHLDEKHLSEKMMNAGQSGRKTTPGTPVDPRLGTPRPPWEGPTNNDSAQGQREPTVKDSYPPTYQ